MTVFFTLFDTAIGRCAIAWGARGVLCLQLSESTEAKTYDRVLQRYPAAQEAAPPLQIVQARCAVVALLRGTPSDLFSIPLDMDGLPPFHRRVYEAARAIPFGAATTYGALAKRAGAAGAARAVGLALARNPFAIIVPCHRVLAAGGKTGGFSANGGTSTKLRLLAIEGHKIGPAKSLVKSVKGNRAPSLFNRSAAIEASRSGAEFGKRGEMAWPEQLQPLSLPVIGAPLFIISNPRLVIAQCTSGIIGAFPALNARPEPALGDWLFEITSGLAKFKQSNPGAEIAPFAVNQIIHPSNDRLASDLDLCEKYKVPIVITSLSAPTQIVPRVHAWGGLVFHDVISVRHAKKAIEAGVDGLILVCAGAGGHAGTLSPFALLEEVRTFWQGPIALAGAIATGRGVLAARAMGADFAYVGTRFIASEEATADPLYKQMITTADAADIVYSSYFTGVPGNYLRQSVINAGLDPNHLPSRDKTAMNFEAATEAVKAWRDIWGAGQSVGAIFDVLPAAAIIARMRAEYVSAKRDLCSK